MLSAKAVERLSTDPWFGQLDGQLKHLLLTRGTLLDLRGGEFVFRQGDEPNGFYGLCNGFLKVSTLREDGKEAIATILEAGNWFGEASCIDGLRRSHDVSAAGPAALLRIDRDSFRKLMERHGFANAIALLQARHTRVTYANLEDVTLRTVRAGLARRLQRLARGDVTMDVVDRRVIHVTHEILAMMLGVTRQTLALELKALVEAGAITLGYGRIEIESMEILKRIEKE